MSSSRKLVEFVRPKDLESSGDVSAVDDGVSAASFYKTLVKNHFGCDLDSRTSSGSSNYYCEICHKYIERGSNHDLSVAHQLNHPVFDAPIQPLPVSKDNVGYKYLVKHGWSPISSNGLGIEGRQGNRLPLKVDKIKNDKQGVGKTLVDDEPSKNRRRARVTKPSSAKPVMTGKEIRRQELRDRRRHCRIMEELNQK